MNFYRYIAVVPKIKHIFFSKNSGKIDKIKQNEYTFEDIYMLSLCIPEEMFHWELVCRKLKRKKCLIETLTHNSGYIKRRENKKEYHRYFKIYSSQLERLHLHR